MINAYHSSCYFESHEVICTIFIMKWEALTKMESCIKWKMKEFLVFFLYVKEKWNRFYVAWKKRSKIIISFEYEGQKHSDKS